MHSSNSYVATSIIMSQHSFSAASASWYRDLSFHVATASLFRLCCNTVLYYLHFCRDRGLLPLSLTSCCNFVLMLRHDFLVLSIFTVATQFSCCDQTLLCSVYSFCRDPVCCIMTELLCNVLKPLSRPRKVCHDLVSLCSAYFCVVTLRSMLRHRLISSA